MTDRRAAGLQVGECRDGAGCDPDRRAGMLRAFGLGAARLCVPSRLQVLDRVAQSGAGIGAGAGALAARDAVIAGVSGADVIGPGRNGHRAFGLPKGRNAGSMPQ